MQSLKSGPKKSMNPQTAAIAGSGNPLKSRFESEIRAKYIFKIRRSVCLFTPLVNALAAQSYLLQTLVYIEAGIKIHYIRYLSIWLWLFKSWIEQSTR